SMGIACYPRDGSDANELVHQADLAVYRAKLQGRNRVVDSSEESFLAQPEKRAPRLLSLPDAGDEPVRQLASVPEAAPPIDRRSISRPHAHSGPRFLWV